MAAQSGPQQGQTTRVTHLGLTFPLDPAVCARWLCVMGGTEGWGGGGPFLGGSML